jgi:hypothetical protein
MIVSSPECDKKLRVSSETGPAKRVKCPGCSTTFVVRAQEEQTEGRESTAVRAKGRPRDDEYDDEDVEDSPPAKRRKRTRSEDDEDDEDLDAGPARRPRTRARDDEDDEEYDERPARRKKKKKAKSHVLLLSLVFGGVALVAVVAGLLIFFLSRGSPFSQHEAAAREGLAMMNELVAAIESVKDPNSARAAASRIHQICDRVQALERRIRNLPKLTVEENRRLESTMNAEFAALTQRMTQVGFQAGRNAGGEPSFVAAIKRLQSMKNLGK